MIKYSWSKNSLYKPNKRKNYKSEMFRYFTLKKGDTGIIENEIKSLLCLEHLSSQKGENSTFCTDLKKKPFSACYFPANEVQ